MAVIKEALENNRDIVQEPALRRRLPNILLSEASLPELEQGALELGFARPIEPPPPIAPHIVHAGREIEVKFSAEAIAGRVQEIAEAVSQKYLNSERQLIVVGVLKGCSPFLSDLLRAMDSRMLMEVDFVELTSCGKQLEAAREANIHLPQADIEGKDVLLVDAILDSGTTLNRIIKQLYQRKPHSINACVLVQKIARPCEPVPELYYRGFALESGWAVGYGMDYEHYYSNLPYVGVLKNIL